MNEINKTVLTEIFKNNKTFSSVEPEMQKQMLAKIADNKFDLDQFNNERVGIEFLKYLVKVEKFDLKQNFDDLKNYLKIIALLNSRERIIQSDLFLLSKIDLSLENWKAKVLSALRHTMFFQFYVKVDENATIKDELTQKVENHDLKIADKEKAKQLYDWSNQTVNQLIDARDKALNSEQLKNCFYQSEIINFYDQSVDILVRIFRFHALGFSMAMDK